MGFVVLHMEKAHGSDSGTTAHIERFIIPKNADPTRTHLNRKLIDYPDGVKDRTAAIQHRLENAGLTRKIGNNQVQAIRIIVSGTHEDMERIEKEGRLDEWCADNMSYFAFMFGKENIVAAHLHRDEETPHIHITLVPIVKGERKRRKREEQTKKRYRKKPTDTVRLCADDIMTRLKLKTYQDTYAIAMAKYGLQRGIDGSTARHKSTQQYYRDTQKLVDSLKAEVVDLQERKEAARQELRQAKKEVQTEKLKGAATTAATNIAESVGSFFGSNKVKTLERENAALHREVATHGEAIEALQAVGLGDRLEHKSNQMSGGQMQRVAIARALVNNPAVILADEATGNLDTRTSFEILVLFQKLHAEGRTIIFVTHNPEIAQYSSRNIVLRDGQIKDDTINTQIQNAAEALAALPKQEEEE